VRFDDPVGIADILSEPSEPRTERRTLSDASFALDYLPAKLLNLADGFKTATGSLLAAQRHEAVRDFYHGMLNEVSWQP
jgi:uncharacterized protein